MPACLLPGLMALSIEASKGTHHSLILTHTLFKKVQPTGIAGSHELLDRAEVAAQALVERPAVAEVQPAAAGRKGLH